MKSNDEREKVKERILGCEYVEFSFTLRVCVSSKTKLIKKRKISSLYSIVYILQSQKHKKHKESPNHSRPNTTLREYSFSKGDNNFSHNFWFKKNNERERD